jgi:hypothetical protein
MDLVRGKWLKDEELNMWVMLSRSGMVLIAKPGQRSRKVTEEEYYQIRREEIATTRTHDRMKADDPSSGQESEQVPAPNTRQLTLGSSRNAVSGGSENVITASSNIMIGSDLNITRHSTRSRNRHRHGHGSQVI